MQPNERAKYAYNYYINKGVPAQVAAGLVANFAIESGNFDDAVISGKRRGDDGTAHYTQQLRHERKDNYLSYAKAKGVDPGTFEAQLDFALEEMTAGSPYADAGAVKNRDLIFGAQDASTAAQYVMQHYERASSDPKLNHIQKRTDYANALMGTKPDEGTAPPPPTAAANTQSAPVGSTEAPSTADTYRPTVGDAFIQAGRIMAGEAPSALTYRSAYAPVGGSADSQGTIPETQTNSAVAIGKDQALNASSQTAFGINPTHEGVKVDGADPNLMTALNLVSQDVGYALPVNSLFRDQGHQNRLKAKAGDSGLVARQSKHTDGQAADISIAGMDADKVSTLVRALANRGFNAFGHYKNHIHADMRPNVPSSFNPDTGWGGWTSLPAHVMQPLVEMGFRAGLAGDKIKRDGFGAALTGT